LAANAYLGLAHDVPPITMLPLGQGEDGSKIFLNGAFATWDDSESDDHYTSQQRFSHTSEFTNSRSAIATPPYHWHIYQTMGLPFKSKRIKLI
jgi:hypothetical protein